MEYIYESVAAQNKSLIRAQYTLDKALTEASRDGYEPFGETTVGYEPMPKEDDEDYGEYVLVQQLRRPAYTEPAQPKLSDLMDALMAINNKLAAIEAALH